MEFRPMPKVPRLSREIIITEKIDGTNASIYVAPLGVLDSPTLGLESAEVDGLGLWVGSRTRWITPQDDNYGFAKWVRDNAKQLVKLGAGHHFGEWWGVGINRNYGLSERRFSLFNVSRWAPYQSGFAGDECPACCSLVPTLYRGDFVIDAVGDALARLVRDGSVAAPGFADPEGVMVYHTAANQIFKKTIKGDDAGKSYEGHVKKERLPKPERVKGPRRRAQVEISFPDRRVRAAKSA